MKTKKFTIEVKTPKARGHVPPPGFAFRSKRTYNRRQLKSKMEE